MQFSRNEDAILVEVAVSLLPFTSAQVLEELHAAGYGRCFILGEQLNQLMADYQAVQSEIKLHKRPDGSRIQRKIALRKNAELKLEISADAMTATAAVTAAWGGSPVSANDLVKAAQDYGIHFGFQKEQIVQLVTAASRAEPGTVSTQIIALGRVMEPGLNARFEPLVEGMSVRSTKPVVLSQSRVDLRDFGVIPAVVAGQPVVRRLPPTKGVDGINVRGEIALAPPGLPLEWKPGEGAEVSPSDPDLLLATRDGMPRVLEAGAAVDEVYAVKKVDLSTGHIQFKGAVIVNGDVTESMKVIAGGNVFIKGTMEGALIESGGDVSIGGSVIGHQLASEEDNEELFSTVVKAKGDVRCTLAQYAEIDAGGDFHAAKQINHCKVAARMVVAGPEDKLTGKVVGGNFYLDLGIKAGVLGSPSESSLKLNLNRRVDPVVEKQQALRQNVASIKLEMEQIKQGIDELKKLEKSDATNEHINAFIEEFEAQRTVAVALIEDIKRLEQQKLGLMAEAAVLVKQQLYAGVEVLLGTERLTTKREHGPSMIKLVEAALKLDPLL